MLLAFEQFGLLMIFISIGYLFGKIGLVDHNHAKVLSVVGVYLFLPCTIFNSFSNSFTPANLTVYYPLLLASLVILMVLFLFARIVSHALAPTANYERRVFFYSLIVPNYGYMTVRRGRAFGTDHLLPAHLHLYLYRRLRLTHQASYLL